MISTQDISRPDPDLIERIRQIGTATTTSSLFHLGIHNSHLCGPISWTKGKCLAGPALTLQFVPKREDLAPLHRSGNAATEESVRAELAAVFATQPLSHWSALFADGQACVAPVLRLNEALAHPQFRARGMVLEGGEGAPRQLGVPVKLSGHVPGPPRPAPQPGEHTDEVLREAGFQQAEIHALRAAGAIA